MTKKTTSTLRIAVRRLAPWVLVIGILAYLFARVEFAEVQASLARTSLPGILVFALAGVLAIYLTDSFTFWVAIRETISHPKISYRQAAQLRGASYLLTLINFGVGQGSLIYFLRRRFGIPLKDGGAPILLAAGVFFIVIAMTMGIGILAGALPQAEELRILGIVVIALVPIYLLLIHLKPGWFARLPVFSGLFRAGLGGTLRVGIARTAHVISLVTVHWGAMRLFGIQTPIEVALVGLPVVFIVGAVPIAPSGLGTTQAAAVALFSSYAPGATGQAQQATVLAYSLGFQIISSAIVALVGGFCLRRLQRFDNPKKQA